MTAPKESLRIAILCSTSGSDLPAIFAMNSQHYDFRFLLTNKEDCGARKKAQQYGIPDIFLDAAGKTREQYDREILELLKKEKIDLVLLVGWMRILSPILVEAYAHKIMNVHPSLLPLFAGGMDTNVHEAVLASGISETGATIHFVTEEADAGPIILQKSCPISPDETPESLKAKVQKLEQEMFPQAIELYRLGRLQVLDGKVRILS